MGKKSSMIIGICTNPFIWLFVYMSHSCIQRDLVKQKSIAIHQREYPRYREIPHERVETAFREEQKKKGLEQVSIDLVLDSFSSARFYYSGSMLPLKNGTYQVTLYPPFLRPAIRHELSHVEDHLHGRLKLPCIDSNLKLLRSERRALNYSIAEPPRKTE